MQVTIDGVHYKFLPSRLSEGKDIVKRAATMKNDVYEKFEATASVDGELIVCKDVQCLRRSVKKIVRETYEDYLSTIEKRDPKKDKWIYNILDGTSEQESVLHRDDLCVVLPTYTWDGKNVDKLHILCMPTDTSLRCIRSLTNSHIPLLEHMKRETLRVIREVYHLDECHLKMFFHYEPSTYHLHIHFVNTAFYEAFSSVEYSHELNTVMFNLSLCGDYYQRTVLNKRL